MVSSAVLNNHANVAINQESGTIAAPNGPANFLLSTDQKSVSNYVRQGDDLTIEFADGRVLRVQGFFANGADFNNLVFVHDGERWLTNFSQALGSGGDGVIDPLVAYERITEGNSTAALLGILGAAAAGGAIAAVSGGDDDPEPRDTTAPNAPTLVAMDDKAPVVGPIANNSKTNDSTPTLSGTGEAGSTIKVYDNGKLIGTTIVGADGRWTFTPQVPLADGAHEVTVTATDKANNTSQTSPKLVIVVDTIAPSVPTVNGTDDKAPVTGPISNGGTTNDTTPTLKGAAEPGALVKIFDNGVEIGTARVNSEGSWNFTPTTPLREGPHSITAAVTDEAGNISSPSAVLTFTVDATSPLTAPTIGGLSDDRAPVIGQVVNGGFTNDDTPRLAGSGAEPDSTVNIYDKGALIGSVKADGSGNWSFTPATPLSEGAHSLTTTNVDKAGNEGPASAPFVVTVDTTAPAVPAAPASYADDAGAIQNPANTAATTDDTTPGINIGTVPAGTTPSLYVDGVKVPAAYDAATGTLTPVNVLPEGAHQISYSLTDAAGNESAPSAPLSVTVDTTAPATPAAPASYADNAGAIQDPASTAATTDDTTPGINIGTVPAGTTPSLYVDGTKVDATYDPATGTLTPATPLAEGAHQISYMLTDAAGNESAPSAPLSVTVDTTVPATPAAPASYADNAGSVQDPASTAATTDDPTPGINIGTVPAGTTPSLYVDGVKVPAAYDAATGTLTPATPLAEGAHQLSYTLTDAAGNESAPSAPLSVTVDTTAPPTPAPPASYADDAGAVQDPASTVATTDDTTPGINIGTVPAGTTPSLYVDGTKVGATYDPAAGTLTPVTPLADGPRQLSYTLTDEAGNESNPSPALAITVDTTAPNNPYFLIDEWIDNVGAIRGAYSQGMGSPTDDTQPEFRGSGAEPNSTVRIYDGSTLIGSTTADASGKWTFSPATPLAEGTYSFYARNVDVAGNEGIASNTFTLHIDTTAPTSAPVLGAVTDDVPFVVGPLSSGDATNDNRPSLTGSGAEPNGTVNIYDNGTVIGTATADAAGNWSFTPAAGSELADGAHSLTVSTVDAAGNEGPKSGPFAFTVDTIAPTQSTVITAVNDDQPAQTGAVASNGYTNDTTPAISGTISAALNAGERVVVLRDGAVVGAATVTGTSWSFSDAGLSDGQTYLYTARVEDAAGNRGAISGSHTIHVDTSAPTQTVTISTVVDNVAPAEGTIANGGTTNDSQPELQGTLSAALGGNEVVAVYRDGVRIGTAQVTGSSWSFIDMTGLSNGSSYSYTARVEDAAGNTGPNSSSYAITLQTTGPATTATITAVTDDAAPQTGAVANNDHTNDTTPAISGTLSAALAAGETVVVLRDGVAIGAATVTGQSWTFADSGLVDGQSYVYTARVQDAASNPGADSNAYTIHVDTSVPTQSVVLTRAIDNVDPVSGDIPAGGVTNDDTPTLEGTISVALTGTEQVRIFRNGVDIGAATVVGTNWSFEDASLASGSTYTYEAKVVDAAGNASTASNSLSFSINTSGVNQTVQILQVQDDVDPQQGLVANGGSTNDPTPTLSGSISSALNAGDAVEVLRNGAVVGTATVTGTTWTFADSGLADGQSYAYTARVVNSGGNQGSQSAAYVVTVDRTAPTQTAAITSYTDNRDPQQGSFPSGSTTNDDTPALNGTISAALGTGEVVAIYRDGTKIGTATVSGTSWTFQDSGLVDGASYTYTARVEDAAGNQGTVSAGFSLTVDQTAPASAPVLGAVTDDVPFVVGPLSAGDATNDNRPALTGSGAEPNSTVNIYDNGTVIGTATADAAGNWSFTPAAGSELADGAHSLTVSTVDAAGNEGPLSGPFAFMVDTIAPTHSTVITAVNDDQPAQTGAVANNGYTNDTTPAISGTISAALNAGERVVVLRDGAVVGTAAMTDATHWSFNDSGVVDGQSYVYTARVEDAAGNRGAISGSHTIHVDTSAPSQTVTISTVVDNVAPAEGTIANGGTTNDSQPELQGTLSAALGGNEVVAVYRDGVRIGTAQVTGSSWSFIDQTGLSNGSSYSYTARVEDAAGNTGPNSSSYAITLQTTGPATTATITAVNDDAAPQTGAVTNNGHTNDTTPAISGTLSAALAAGETVVVLRDGVAIGTATVTGQSWTFADSGLVDGQSYVYTARVQDAASNPGADSNAYTIHIDTSVPTQSVMLTRAIDNVDPVSGDILAGGVTNDDTPTLEGTISAALTGTEQVRIFRNGIDIGAATVVGTSWTFEDASLASGSTYTYEAKVVDAAGNASTASNSLSFSINTSGVNQTVQILQVQDDVDPQQGLVANGGSTNDPTPTLSGSISSALNAGDVVEVLRNGAVVGTATVTGTTWSFADSGLVDGQSYSYTARVVNSGGNQGSQSAAYVVTVDRTAPTQTAAITSYTDNRDPQQGSFLSGSTTNDDTPALHGTISAALGTGEVVAIYRDGTKIGTATVSGTSWTFQDSGLADGQTYSYTARVEDAAGNQGTVSANFSLTVDITAPATPAAPTSFADDAGSIQNPASTAATTDDTTPGINIGTVPAGTTPSLYVDGVKVPATYDAATGTLTPATPLAEGAHQLSYTLTDAAGNESGQSGALSVTVDTTAPVAPAAPASYADNAGSIQDPASTAATTDDTTPGINIGTVPAGTTPSLYVDGVKVPAAYDAATGTLTPVNALPEGAHQLSYTLTDAAGNESGQSGALSVTVDTTAPAAPAAPASYADNAGSIQDPASTAAATDDTTPGINIGTVPAGTTPSLYVDGVKVPATYDAATGTLTPATPLAEGVHQLSYTLTDPAGNESGQSGALSVSVDTTAPAAPAAPASFADDAGSIQNPASTAATTDDTTPGINIGTVPAGTTPSLYVDGVKVPAIYDAATGTLTPVNALPEGAHQLSYTLTDAAGNESGQSGALSVTVDTTAPTVPAAPASYADNAGSIQDPASTAATTDDTTPGINIGTVPAGTTPSLYVDGVKVPATYDAATGTLTPVNALPEGAHQLSYSLTDAAGNESAPSAPFSVTVDTTAPTVPAAPASFADDAGSIQNPASTAAATDDTTPGINIGTVPAGTTPSLYVDGVKVPAAYDAATGTLTPATPLAEGAHQLSYTLTDVAGNESGQSGALSVTVDTTAPASSIVIDITSITDDTGASNADFVTKDTNLIVNGALTGTLGVGEEAQISIDGGANWIDLTVSGGNWSYADGRTLTDGSYTYQVRVVDAAGNVGTTDSQIVTVDTTPPASSIVIDITSISDDTGLAGDFITRDTALTVNGTLAGTLGAGEKAQISVDGGASWSDLTVTGGAWSYADGRTLTDGNYTYQVRVVDTAGNVGTTDSQVVIVDTTPPSSTATIVSFTDNVGTLQGNFASGLTTDDRTPVLNGTTSTALGAGEVVRIYDGTTLVGTATMTGSQTWSFALPNLADGSSHAYRAAVADAAGNESTPSGQFTLHVDLTVVVNAQSTLDTTPIVTGSTGFEIQPGEHVEVTINGKTYSSQTGAVVVDPINNTWYVQIPVGDALAAGTTYNVVAVLKDALGFVITQDDTVAELVIGSPLAAPTIPGSTDAANKATAMTIGEDGQWRIFSNMTVLDANGTNVTNVASFSTNALKGNEGVFGSVTFMDFDRDGDMDMFGVDSAYWDGQQAFENRGPGYVQPSVPGTTPSNTNNGYYAFQVGNEALYSDRVAYSGSGTTSANTWSWYGGAAAYDKVGDGYVDMVYGDNTPIDEEAGGGYDTSFVLNDGGATPFRKDPAIGFDSVPWPDERYQATPEKLISTVDLNNDGAVDIAYQGAAGTNYITGNSTITANNYRLVITSNFGNGNLDVTQIVENTLYNQEGLTFDGPSMTWADFDGDGWLDLFQARTYGATAAIQNQSKIFFNDGTGKISANNTDSDPIHESYNRHYNMGDSLAGGGSVAVDWNADGRMDVIEIPYYTGADPNGMQNVLLFSNNSAGGAVSFSQSTLTTMADTGAGSAITGLLTLDLDWDGDRDAIFFTGTAGAKLVQNNAAVAEGTSLHLRILDKNGINALYGNTVKLYDSNGNLVATRVLNPQSGNQTSDSSAILDFYGLNPSETYTAVLLRNIGGSSQDVGGVTSIGGHSIENVNASWTGLTTGPAHDAYVLTAEAGGAVNNANTGNGIIGTGYNDTFFATLGADKFDGGGGTTIVSNSRQWSNTGGMDVVDYKLAGSTPINVDLSVAAAQNTGFGSQTFLNIEGIAGGSGNDTFTDSAADNVLNGRGGTDTFHLTHGGRDTLLYELINGADATGGNGSDVIYGFKVGTYEATPNADRIDISQLLSGYTKDADGAAHYINGVATMDAGETIGDFVNVTSSGGITTISIDRDGSGGAFGATPLVTLQNVTTDLETLLANHQIVV